MNDTYEFDAHISVMAESHSKDEAADKILEHCLDGDIACSLHEENPWPLGFVSEILTLLDLIEVEDDASLAKQRFEIGEKYGLTVEFGEPISGAKH